MNYPKLKRMALAVVVLIALFIFVCPAYPKEAAEGKNDKAAVINGRPIPMDDFERLYAMQIKRLPTQSTNLPPAYIKQVRAQLIDSMVTKELLYQESQKQKIIVGKEDIDKEIAAFQKRFPGPEQYQIWLKNVQFTEEEFRAQLTKDMMIQALLEKDIISKIDVKEKEAKAYFDKHPEKFRIDETVRARHILIKVESSADNKTKAEARKQLDEIKKKVLAGEDFEALAKTHSQGPSRSRGGDLGYFKRGQMVKPFDEAAFTLAVNEVSDIVETRFGYHLIKVLDHKTAQNPKFEEAKPKAVKTLRSERFQMKMKDYITDLRKDADIKIFIE